MVVGEDENEIMRSCSGVPRGCYVRDGYSEKVQVGNEGGEWWIMMMCEW